MFPKLVIREPKGAFTYSAPQQGVVRAIKNADLRENLQTFFFQCSFLKCGIRLHMCTKLQHFPIIIIDDFTANCNRLKMWKHSRI